MHFEKTEEFMTEQAKLFAQDVFNNIIGGDASSANEEMNFFDGLLTVMSVDINDGTVNQAAKNLIPSGVFDAPQSEGDSAAYDPATTLSPSPTPSSRSTALTRAHSGSTTATSSCPDTQSAPSSPSTTTREHSHSQPSRATSCWA